MVQLAFRALDGGAHTLDRAIELALLIFAAQHAEAVGNHGAWR
jgi:hypothetical protein